jgi:hypothetical protein
MKTLEFIKNNIGNKVYITSDRDMLCNGDIKHLILNKEVLILLGLTKGGLAELKDSKGNIYKIRPTNVREFNT